MDLNQERVKMSITTTAIIISGYFYVCSVYARHCVNRFTYYLHYNAKNKSVKVIFISPVLVHILHKADTKRGPNVQTCFPVWKCLEMGENAEGSRVRWEVFRLWCQSDLHWRERGLKTGWK